MVLREHDLIRLLVDVPSEGVVRGQTGAITLLSVDVPGYALLEMDPVTDDPDEESAIVAVPIAALEVIGRPLDPESLAGGDAPDAAGPLDRTTQK
jgi:hypothetical protein